MLRKLSRRATLLLAAAVAVLAFASGAVAGGGGSGSNTISNGNFETANGLQGPKWFYDCWAGYPTCNGEWIIWKKKVTPISNYSWPSPMQGNWSAIADEGSADTLVLYQRIKVSKPNSKISGDYEWKNHEEGWCNLPFDWDPHDGDVSCPDDGYNQQFRIDLLYDGSSPWSTNPNDVIKTIFQTDDNTPLSQNKTTFSKNIPGFSGYAILRVMVVAGDYYLQVGVDAFDVNAGG